jgi:predicted DNA-binding protein (MmcQ/YjbR family)
MTLSEIEAICLKKPGAYLDWPFGPEHSVVKVKAPSQEKGRIFAQPFTLRGEPKVTLNCDMMTGEFYRSLYPSAVTRGWHCPPVQQPYFNTVSLDGTVSDDVLLEMIEHSYTVVTGKLPKKFQAELEGEQCEVNRT